MTELLQFIGEFLRILGVVVFTLTAVSGLGLVAFVGIRDAIQLFKQK